MALWILSLTLHVRWHARSMFDPSSIPAWFIGVAGALVAFAVAYALTHSPFTLYDSLSYHLFFSARWLQDRALSIVLAARQSFDTGRRIEISINGSGEKTT